MVKTFRCLLSVIRQMSPFEHDVCELFVKMNGLSRFMKLYISAHERDALIMPASLAEISIFSNQSED